MFGASGAWAWGVGGAAAVTGGDVTAPVISSATIPASGEYIDLVYNESLDNTSTPATGDFTINVPSSSPPTISGISFQTTSLTNDTVRVAVSTDLYSVESGVTIDYTAGVNPIRDVAENNAANLTAEAVTNNSTQFPAGSSLIVDLDGDLSVTLNGGFVETWGCQADGNDITQATAGKRPGYTASNAGYNSHGTVDFDGTDDELERTSLVGGTITQPTTTIFVMDHAETSGRYADDGATTGRHIIQNDPTGTTPRQQFWATSFVTAATGLAIGTKKVLVTEFDGASSRMRELPDGASVIETTGNPGTNGLSGVNIGGGANYATTSVARRLDWDAVLTTRELAVMEEYLKTTYDITPS